MKTFLSKYIKEVDLSNADVARLRADISVYNTILHKMVNDLMRPQDGDISFYKKYAHTYPFSSYMALSLVHAATGIVNAGKESLKLDISNTQLQIQQMKKKALSLQRQIDRMISMKTSLIERSKARKAGKDLPEFVNKWGGFIRTTKGKNGTLSFEVYSKLPSKGKPGVFRTFENEYLFETLYVNPYLKRKKQHLHQIQCRIHNTQGHLENLQRKLKSGHPSICFGGKDLLRDRTQSVATSIIHPRKDYRKNKHYNAEKTAQKIKRQEVVSKFHHDPYLTARYIKKNKEQCAAVIRREMMLIGQADRPQGNTLVRYDIPSKTLIYTSMDKTQIRIPNVVFPYGQELIEQALQAHEIAIQNKKRSPLDQLPGWTPIPVTWAIEQCGHGFRIKCMIDVPAKTPEISDYSKGCIAFDMNYDHIAAAEIGECGDLIWHKVLPLNMNNTTSNQRKNAISEALEQLFYLAKHLGKPIAMEDIEKIQQEPLYGSRKKNRKVSQFAYTIMTELANSKAQKYGVSVKAVNPAYTSQIGKFKYMKKYGLSIHEAAAYTIGRRAMGWIEPIPANLQHLIPAEKQTQHEWSQWNYLSKGLKKVPTYKFYENIDFSKYSTLAKANKSLSA